MANNNRVGDRTAESFGYFKIASARGVNIAATGNAIVAMPILDGGLTASGANTSSGVAIVRRITIGNYTAGNLAVANVSVGWTNDGGNLVANAQILSSITTNNMFQDLTISPIGNNTFVNGNVSSVLYFNMVANAVASGTVDVVVTGQVIKA